MKKLVTAFSLTVCLMLCLSGRTTARVMIDDPGIADTVWSDSSFTVIGDPLILPVYFVNDEPLAALEVTLRHNSPAAVIDSFSFAGGRVDYINIKGVSIVNDTATVYAYQSDEAAIAAGRGLLGNLFLSYPPGTTPHLIELDTVTVIIDLIERGNYFTVEQLQSFSPQFRKGYRNLQLTCCSGGPTGDINGDGEPVVDIVDLTYLIVYLFIDASMVPPCMAAANVDGSPDGVVDIGDLTQLIGYLFISAQDNPLADCP